MTLIRESLTEMLLCCAKKKTKKKIIIIWLKMNTRLINLSEQADKIHFEYEYWNMLWFIFYIWFYGHVGLLHHCNRCNTKYSLHYHFNWLNMEFVYKYMYKYNAYACIHAFIILQKLKIHHSDLDSRNE